MTVNVEFGTTVGLRTTAMLHEVGARFEEYLASRTVEVTTKSMIFSQALMRKLYASTKNAIGGPTKLSNSASAMLPAPMSSGALRATSSRFRAVGIDHVIAPDKIIQPLGSSRASTGINAERGCNFKAHITF